MELKNKNDMLFGTKIYNNKTNEIGLLIYTWTNSFADRDIEYATCVDKSGKKYNIEMDEITPVDTME